LKADDISTRTVAPQAAPAAKRRVPGIVRSAAGTFTGGTASWIVMGLLVSGDSWVSPLSAVVVLVAAAAGGILATRLRTRGAAIALGVAVIGCAVFWLAAPRGWWAVAPPPG
jgi:hypothetical protein